MVIIFFNSTLLPLEANEQQADSYGKVWRMQTRLNLLAFYGVPCILGSPVQPSPIIATPIP